MTLDRAPLSEPVVLAHPETPVAQTRRLAELGLRAGIQVTPGHRTAGGGRVIGLGAARIALARSVLTDLRLRRGEPLAAVDHQRHPGRQDQWSLQAKLCGCHTEAARCAPEGAPVVALAGNPNVGKSTLFNNLTGARRHVSNWPGTTVEAGRGAWRAGGATLALIDLPGAYSLDPLSPDEQLTRSLLLDVPERERPDVVVVVMNAACLGRGLYLLSQVRERGMRTVAALTMMDVAAKRGAVLDLERLSTAVGAEAVPLDPRRVRGCVALEQAVERALASDPPAPLALGSAGGDAAHGGEAIEDGLAAADARFTWISGVVDEVTRSVAPDRQTRSDRIDRIVTSPVLGPAIFLGVMWLVFQLTTIVAAPLIDGLDRLVSGPVSSGAQRLLAAAGLGGTWVEGLIVDGLIAGVGMVLTFAPLMALMFAVLALLEDSGYLARAAVVADRLMRLVGLPGRAFVPLIVGFGCNVPAISATRILPSARHRLMTALLVPFTSCSARLPVYVLVGAAMFGERAGTVVFGMYVASIGFIVLGGVLLRVTVLRGTQPEPLILDLPSYQVPVPRILLALTWTRLLAFLRTATGVIVVTVVAVWLLTAIPARSGAGGFGEVEVSDSAFAAVASAVAPVFQPAGFGDWHTAGALMVGFVAKEAVVASWAQTYAAEEPEDLAQPGVLGDAVRADFEETSGGHTGLAGIAFLLFLLGYSPCVATLTAQIREIGLRWAAVGVGMNLLVAWIAAVLVFQIGRILL
ncbi:MAG: ferrous iron transport protein B [Micromonosporaceae bacterium]|nr:ferrous iron transport protein B [Micromonosporaceae bacterium]